VAHLKQVKILLPLLFEKHVTHVWPDGASTMKNIYFIDLPGLVTGIPSGKNCTEFYSLFTCYKLNKCI
jgi:hypothetical protein